MVTFVQYKVRAQKFALAFTSEGWRYIGSVMLSKKYHISMRKGNHVLSIAVSSQGIDIYRDGRLVKSEQ